mmetsp:Transcript_13879/g.39936  ORF Transcript_13879/g.39936 Transcript_13879/m.39936 type:complete len:231 (+) Transcript_13879:298-990(+)
MTAWRAQNAKPTANYLSLHGTCHVKTGTPQVAITHTHPHKHCDRHISRQGREAGKKPLHLSVTAAPHCPRARHHSHPHRPPLVLALSSPLIDLPMDDAPMGTPAQSTSPAPDQPSAGSPRPTPERHCRPHSPDRSAHRPKRTGRLPGRPGEPRTSSMIVSGTPPRPTGATLRRGRACRDTTRTGRQRTASETMFACRGKAICFAAPLGGNQPPFCVHGPRRVAPPGCRGR